MNILENLPKVLKIHLQIYEGTEVDNFNKIKKILSNLNLSKLFKFYKYLLIKPMY